MFNSQYWAGQRECGNSLIKFGFSEPKNLRIIIFMKIGLLVQILINYR